jgi:hypothetical protein
MTINLVDGGMEVVEVELVEEHVANHTDPLPVREK